VPSLGGDPAGRIGLPGQGAPMRFALGAGGVVLQVDLLVRGMFKGEVATMLCRRRGLHPRAGISRCGSCSSLISARTL